MAYEIGYVDDTGSEGLAHWQMLLKIKTLAEANGWITLRYLNPTDGSNRELILQGVGVSGTEEVFVGFRSYHSVASDYYNLSLAGFTGYNAGQTFENQPGYLERGICAHNRHIDYWLAVHGGRIAMALKISAPIVYEVGYVGKYLPYALPGQLPYPIVVCGTLNGIPATRFSDASASHSSGCVGNNSNGAFRDLMGVWTLFEVPAWSAYLNPSASIRRPAGAYYHAMPAEVVSGPRTNTANVFGSVWGKLDGVQYITGFDNVSENTCTIDGVTHVMFGNSFRNGIGDFILLEMA